MAWSPTGQDRERAEGLWQRLSAFRDRIFEADTDGEFDPSEFDELIAMVRVPPPDGTEDEWRSLLDSAETLVASLDVPVTVEFQMGPSTTVMAYNPLTGETGTTLDTDDAMLDRSRSRPLSVEPPSGPANPASALVAVVPGLAETLATPDPRVPVVANWSWPCGESQSPGNYWSHWLEEWTDEDSALLESVWTRAEWDAVVRDAIEQWTWRWPPKADAALFLRFPEVEAQLERAHDADPRFARKREAHRERWVSTALQVGLHEVYRRRTTWPDPQPVVCAICGRAFPPEGLSQWMERYGPPRYCQPCCVRAMNGRDEPVDGEYVTAALRCLTDALGFVPSSSLRRLDIGSMSDEQRRDRAMAALMCLPPNGACGEALGVEGGSGQWLRILQAAGVVGDAWRPGRGTLCIAADGHACRSLGERAVDDWLSSHGVDHECEPPWPRHPEFNRLKLKRADWLLPNGTFVEYAGMLEDDTYRAKIAEKVRLAQGGGVELLVLIPDDLMKLDAVLGRHAG